MSQSPPPRKILFSQRRSKEFLYLPEVDALVAATQLTCSPIRTAIKRSLCCYSAKPCNPLKFVGCESCDVKLADKIILVTRNRPLTTRYQPQQIVVNLQPLCSPEIDRLQQLYPERTTDWVFPLQSENNA